MIVIKNDNNDGGDIYIWEMWQKSVSTISAFFTQSVSHNMICLYLNKVMQCDYNHFISFAAGFMCLVQETGAGGSENEEEGVGVVCSPAMFFNIKLVIIVAHSASYLLSFASIATQ